MREFRMPSLGADMEEGTLVEWLKSPGDRVSRGEIIAVVETVKGAIEIECFDDGVLHDIAVKPGQTVNVGALMAHIDGQDRKAEPETVDAPTLRARVTPAARKRAAELNIAIDQVKPGRDQTIGLREVEAAVAERPAPQVSIAQRARGPQPGFDRDAMRGAIGKAMARSKREIPHYYAASAIDVTRLIERVGILNATRSVADRILYAAPLIKAAALALKRTPELNGTFEENGHRPSQHIHVGVATAMRGGGLIAPAIHDADQLTVDEVMTRLRDLVARVRNGRIRSSEMSDPTVTLSILGENTADSIQPVIYPPQVAIIGCGASRKRPWVADGDLVVRDVMTLTVAGDHRVSDGRSAARFLVRLDEILQEPEAL